MPKLPILLPELIPLSDEKAFKLHFARWDKRAEPLDDYLRDWELWAGWQRYKPGRDDFNRPKIFSLMNFYPEPDTWLFGGIWDVLARRDDSYEVELTNQAAAYVGRLKIAYSYKDRMTRPFLEKHYERMVVAELLRERYTGRRFPGYEWLDVSFSELELIIRSGRPDWKQALELAKGIYLITDTATDKRYVGAAYGDAGVWSRWTAYILTGSGGNVELRALIDASGLDYCREHFRFSLLEHHTSMVSNETVLERESFWKRVLSTRGLSGLNLN